ncbi:MAG TPA: hypothetical protein VEY69_04600, partial [Lautropia sp.]|nr:hypothetical protein [Lautropia sp.]
GRACTDARGGARKRMAGAGPAPTPTPENALKKARRNDMRLKEVRLKKAPLKVEVTAVLKLETDSIIGPS